MSPTEPRRVLIVEDESLVAIDLADGLKSAGFSPVGPVGTIREALNLIDSGPINAALLDAKLAGEWAGSVAQALADRSIPFAFLTGYRREDLPAKFQDHPLIKKPFALQDVIATIESFLRTAGST